MTVVSQSKSPSTFGLGQIVDKPHQISGKKISLPGPKEQSDYPKDLRWGKGEQDTAELGANTDAKHMFT